MAKVAKPQDQGIVAMICVFIDTFIVLTMTALVMLTSGALNVNNMAENPAAENMAPGGLYHRVPGLRQPVCGHLPAVLRILHRHRLVLLRRSEREVPVRRQGGEGVRLHRGVCVGPPGLHAGGPPGVEPVRTCSTP